MIPAISEALSETGIVNPFPIQSLTIPLTLEGNDIIGQARTGTGKTLAFGITLLQRLARSDEQGKEHGKPRALVITPTRELALQVSRDLEVAGGKLDSRVLCIYGGTPYEDQLSALADGIDVAVGTPGRLLDLYNRRELKLDKVEVLVLDEADEMLDLGFLPDIERLLAATPKDRQTLLFSATMPAPIMALARATLNRPINIRAEGHDAKATVPDITQFAYQAHDLDKPEMLARLLQGKQTTRTIVFTRTKRSAQRLVDDLVDRGFSAVTIHGDLNQAARERALRKFREGKASTLIATDVAARGIDITAVSHVVNYECPDSDATYIHRIGRTGRAGMTGVSVTLVDWPDVARWRMIDQALDLGLSEPAETYSSSPHLYTDLDIPEGTKGRIGSPKKPKRDKHGGRDERGNGKGEGRGRRRRKSEDKQAEATGSKPRRRRKRRRAGVDVTSRPAPR